MKARGTVTDDVGRLEPAAAPRFSGSRWEGSSRPPHPGEHTKTALADWEVDAAALLASGAAVESDSRLAV